ncbi:MAG: DNA-directed RNA polymerase subunit alpha C-terminal domain-containing protein, partial [Phocaeicola sp.]
MKTREDIKAILNLKVDAQYLGLTRRAVNSLLDCGFTYIHEIINVGKNKFIGTRGIGAYCFNEVNEKIERFGLTWEMDV